MIRTAPRRFAQPAARPARRGALSVATLAAVLALTSACSREEAGTGGSPDAALAQAEAALAEGDLGKARVAMLNAAKAAPADGRVALLRARIAAESGDAVGADAAAQEALRLGAKGDAAAWRMEAALMEGDSALALRHDADHPLPAGASAADTANRLRLRGEAQAQGGQLAEARATLDAAIAAQGPGDARANVALGLMALKNGDTMLAGQQATAAIARDPRSVGAHLLAGRIAVAQRDAKGALAHYDKVLAIRPDHADATLGRAAALGPLGRTEEAEGLVDAQLKRTPTHAQALYMKARLLATRGDVAGAQALMQKAGDGFAGDLAMAQKLPDSAIVHYERAIKIAPGVTHLRLLLARAHAANGDAAAARRVLAAFDGIRPEPVEVAALRRELAAAN